jgi:hypothetical protein
MDRSELRDYVRDATLLGTGSLPDAELDLKLDSGIRAISTSFAWPWLDASSALATVPSTQNYAVPATAMHIVAITQDDAKVRLREISPKTAWQRYGGDAPTSDPRTFYIWADELYLLPIPGTIINYTVWFRKEPTVLATDGDEPEWSELFHEVLGDWVIQQVWERQEQFGYAQAAAVEYGGGLERMAQFYMNRADPEPMIYGENPERHGSRYVGNMPWLDGF